MSSIAALGLRADVPLPEGVEGAREAAHRFEALLLEQLLEPLTKSGNEVPGWVDGGSAGRMARELHVAELARIAADRGVLGVEKLLVGAAGSEGDAS